MTNEEALKDPATQSPMQNDRDAADIRLELGSTVLSAVGGSYRFGSVLSVEGDKIEVSFPAPGRRRRASAQRFDREILLLPSDVGGLFDGYPVDSYMLHDLGDLTVRVVKVIGPENDGDATVAVIPVRRENGLWIATGAAETVPRGRLLSALFFAALEERRFRSPVDPYYDVLTHPIGLKGIFEGEFELRFPTVTMPVTGSATFSGFSAELSGSIPAHYATWANDDKVNELIDGETAIKFDATCITMSHLAISNWHISSHAPVSITVRCPVSTVTFRSGSPAFTREIYRGGKLAFAHNIWHREPPTNLIAMMLNVSTAPDCLRTTVFGRPAMIYEPPQPDDDAAKYLAVFYHGAPLDEVRRRALSALIGYLCGGRSAHVATDTFDADGILGIAFADRGDATDQKIMPVPLEYPGEGPLTVVPRFPKILDGMYDHIRRDRQGIEAALHHYSEGAANPYPTKAVGDMSIAIDALIASYTDDDQSNEAIIGGDKFKLLRRALTACLTETFDTEPFAGVTARQRQRFQTKIDNLNTASNTKRFERFWHELGVKLKKGDVKVLRKRHPAVHRGYPEDEASKRALLRSFQDTRRLANLFNRAFLALLGYDGPVLDARPGRRPWLTVDRARTYPAPPRPDNIPTLVVGPVAKRPDTSEPLNNADARANGPP